MNLGFVLLALGALIAHSSALDIYKTCPHFERDNMLVLDCTGQFKNITQANKTLDYTDKFQQKNLILSNNNLDTDFLNNINFTGIKILSVSRNKIQELNFNYTSTWSELTKIDVSFNNLSILNADFFFQFRLIESSNLSNNEISQIKPSVSTEVTFLKNLDLSHNNLTNLTNSIFKNFAKLENLSLSFNFIDSIEQKAFSDLLVLENLKLENNRLKKIDFAIPEKLFNLFLGNYQYGQNTSGNSISVFPNNTSLGMLKTLDLSYNNFTSIPASLNSTNFPELVSVDFTGNFIVENSSLSNGTVKRPLIILGNKNDSVFPNITIKNNQTGSEATNNQTVSIKVQSTLNSTGTENSTVSTEKPLNTTDAIVSNTTSNQNSTIGNNATTPISLSNSTNISNQTLTTGSSNSSMPIANSTLTTSTSSNQTSTTSTDVKATSVTVYTVSIIAAVIAIILIIGLINCYRQSVLKRRRQNRRY